MGLEQVRSQLIYYLWRRFTNRVESALTLENYLKTMGDRVVLDHFAILELPGPQSGITYLHDLFAALGYVTRGKGYLEDKQNDFIWMAEENVVNRYAKEVMPQIVIGEFRLSECSSDVRKILRDLILPAPDPHYSEIRELVRRTQADNLPAARRLLSIVCNLLTRKLHRLPTVNEYLALQRENELLAWTTIFGRQVNHFAISVHLLNGYGSLSDFVNIVEHDLQFKMSHTGGEKIKGGSKDFIEQVSTVNEREKVSVPRGEIEVGKPFLEFVWRYSLGRPNMMSQSWESYFNGFVSKNADKVVESVYEKN